MNFSNTLIQWYLNHKRDLPWRNTQDPYHIWLSEIILQQTRVAQGMPYYFNFTNAFPSVFDLANATEEQVLKLWQGLGYYSRARNLHKTAQYIAFECNGVFPNTYSELIKLKGSDIVRKIISIGKIASSSTPDVIQVTLRRQELVKTDNKCEYRDLRQYNDYFDTTSELTNSSYMLLTPK